MIMGVTGATVRRQTEEEKIINPPARESKDPQGNKILLPQKIHSRALSPAANTHLKATIIRHISAGHPPGLEVCGQEGEILGTAIIKRKSRGREKEGRIPGHERNDQQTEEGRKGIDNPVVISNPVKPNNNSVVTSNPVGT